MITADININIVNDIVEFLRKNKYKLVKINQKEH